MRDSRLDGDLVKMEMAAEEQAKAVIEQFLRAKHPGKPFVLAVKAAIAYTVLWSGETAS